LLQQRKCPRMRRPIAAEGLDPGVIHPHLCPREQTRARSRLLIVSAHAASTSRDSSRGAPRPYPRTAATPPHSAHHSRSPSVPSHRRCHRGTPASARASRTAHRARSRILRTFRFLLIPSRSYHAFTDMIVTCLRYHVKARLTNG